MSNIDQLIDISDEILKLFTSHEAYGKLNSIYEQKKLNIKFLSESLVPYLMKKAVSEGYLYCDKVKEILPKSNLNSEVKSEILALTADENRFFDQFDQHANSMLSKSHDYLAERQRKVRILAKKTEFVSSQECKNKAQTILQNMVPDVTSEITYLDYRKSCT